MVVHANRSLIGLPAGVDTAGIFALKQGRFEMKETPFRLTRNEVTDYGRSGDCIQWAADFALQSPRGSRRGSLIDRNEENAHVSEHCGRELEDTLSASFS